MLFNLIFFMFQALNKEHDLYVWGRGDYGVFGDGNNKDSIFPRKSTYFEELRNRNQMVITKLKSANNCSVALMSDGNLYGWGSNESGQMGVASEIGIELYETCNFLTPVVNDQFLG